MEFALNFSFHWLSSGDLGNGLALPESLHMVVPAAFVAWGLFFAAGADNTALRKVSIANVFGVAAALLMIALAASTAGLPDFWGISLWVGVAAGVLVLLAGLGDWYFIPATFGAFASCVFWWLATGLDGGRKGRRRGQQRGGAGQPGDAGPGAFAGVLSTPYVWVASTSRDADIGVLLGARVREAGRRVHPPQARGALGGHAGRRAPRRRAR